MELLQAKTTRKQGPETYATDWKIRISVALPFQLSINSLERFLIFKRIRLWDEEWTEGLEKTKNNIIWPKKLKLPALF